MKENMLDESWKDKARNHKQAVYPQIDYYEGASDFQNKAIEELEKVYKLMSMKENKVILLQVIDLIKELKTD